MKKILLLIILSILTTGCYAWNMGLYRECSYDKKKDAFYKSVYVDGKYVGVKKCNIKPR